MSTAIKHDQEKPPLAIIPMEGLIHEAKALAYGAKKYSKHNYKLGMKHSRLLDAALRHIYAYAAGENNDQESGVNHLGCAKANLSMLLYMIDNKVGEDDR